MSTDGYWPDGYWPDGYWPGDVVATTISSRGAPRAVVFVDIFKVIVNTSIPRVTNNVSLSRVTVESRAGKAVRATNVGGKIIT